MTVALLEGGCSTAYQPRGADRVGLVIHHAAAMYVKDGREVPVGPFSAELEALVADSPLAAAHARKAHTEFIVGFPTYLTGAVAVVIGVVVLSGPIGWVVIGIGASTAGIGMGVMGAGVTHAIDAVNIHNDAATNRPLPPSR